MLSKCHNTAVDYRSGSYSDCISYTCGHGGAAVTCTSLDSKLINAGSIPKPHLVSLRLKVSTEYQWTLLYCTQSIGSYLCQTSLWENAGCTGIISLTFTCLTVFCNISILMYFILMTVQSTWHYRPFQRYTKCLFPNYFCYVFFYHRNKVCGSRYDVNKIIFMFDWIIW